MLIWTDLGRENSTGFYIYMQGRQSLLTFVTVTRWSRSTSNFYVLIGQNLTDEFMRKMFAASRNLLTDSCSWESFVSSCDVLNCLFLLGVQNEIQLLSRLFCNSWLVSLLRFLLTNAPLVKVIGNPISDGIVFKIAYSLALAWGIRGLKSLKRFWNTWWPFSGFLKSSVWFMRLKFIHEQWSNLQ